MSKVNIAPLIQNLIFQDYCKHVSGHKVRLSVCLFVSAFVYNLYIDISEILINIVLLDKIMFILFLFRITRRV